jgi:cephalosporin hydroxylase
MKLTVGMAVYRDFSGAYFTCQALREYHAGLVDEILVVDNDPERRESDTLAGFAATTAGQACPVRYVYAPEVVGTAAPRDRVFREAAGDVVACVDSHVLLRRGAVAALRDFFAADPSCPDLIQGPMVYDGLAGYATHFMDFWRAEMWGIWGAAWRCPCGRITSVLEEYSENAGMLAFADVMPPHGKLTACPGCGSEYPRGIPFPAHEAKLAAAGFTPALSGEPFEIPAQGLGFFACRKDAWLGFNPRFRGFGGEEFYIQAKYRKAGRRAVCLPQAQWIHRFGRPGGTQYPLTVWHKARNYVIGHQELGLDLKPVHDHFVKTGRMPQHEWDDAVAGLEWPKAVPQPGCGGCGGATQPPPLEDWYRQAWQTPSDINEHCPALRDYASRSESVVEFGVRRGVSTVALLAGQPGRLTSYDLNTTPEVGGLSQRAGRTDFRFVQGDSRYVEIDDCDLLFVDTKHTADQLYAELSRHAPKVRKWIALHDTEIYGERGEDGGPGLLVALRRYLREHPEWGVVRHDANNHGFTVVSRVPSERPKLPSTARQVWNFGKALLSTEECPLGKWPVPIPLPVVEGGES